MNPKNTDITPGIGHRNDKTQASSAAGGYPAAVNYSSMRATLYMVFAQSGMTAPMIPNGGTAALESFLATDQVARTLRTAPPAVRAKVKYLMTVGRRDLDRIRVDGQCLLAGPIRTQDPAFHAYVFSSPLSPPA